MFIVKFEAPWQLKQQWETPHQFSQLALTAMQMPGQMYLNIADQQ